MKSYGCFFVGIGHPSSPEWHLEWRVSFSLQERDLMYGLNPIQHKCYILLKMIKKDMILPRVGKSISSYHCKTCLFHTIERIPEQNWRQENLVHCVRLCLELLLKWLKAENCPNYFIMEENMFDRLPRPLMKEVAKVIEEILVNGCDFIKSLNSDNVGRLTFDSMKGQVVYGMGRSTAAANLFHHTYVDRYSVNQFILRFFFQHSGSENSQETLSSLENYLSILLKTERVTEHKADEVQLARSKLTPHIHLYMAQCVAAILMETEDETNKAISGSFDDHIEKATSCDLMLANLVQATLHFKLDKMDACEQILQKCKSQLTQYVTSCCICYLYKTYMNVALEQHLMTDTLSLNEAVETYVAGCIVFLPIAANFLHEALIYEMYRSVATTPHPRNPVMEFWFDWIVIDSTLYLYFLEYILYSKTNRHGLKQEATESLLHVLTTEPNLGHRETGYNLLGWIYTQENKPLEAMECFIRSWKIRPHHNAAKWHALVLIYKSTKC